MGRRRNAPFGAVELENGITEILFTVDEAAEGDFTARTHHAGSSSLRRIQPSGAILRIHSDAPFDDNIEVEAKPSILLG